MANGSPAEASTYIALSRKSCPLGATSTYLLTYLLSHSRGTPLSHPHCPVGQLRSRVVEPELIFSLWGVSFTFQLRRPNKQQ